MGNFKLFNELHHKDEPLLIGNVWDAGSAKVFERHNYKAVATSSAAVALSHGYKDGEQMPFELLLSTVKRIIAAVTIPVSVDMEAGYGDSSKKIIENIKQLYDAGAVGINIEDCIIEKGNELKSLDESQKTISDIANYLRKANIEMFINARTDGYLMQLPDAFNETILRSKAYENAGANGIFVPCLIDGKEIKQIVQNIKLPVNVMCMPNLPSFAELKDLGIKRISMASFVYMSMTKYLETTIQKIKFSGSFTGLFSESVTEGLKLSDLRR